MKNLIVKMMLKKVFALFSQTKLIWLALLMFGATAHAGVTVRYQHTDTLGSVIMETNASGQMIGSRHQYQPFGRGLNGQKTGLGYTGHLEDTDLGLTYMQQRYYDPVIGRFYSNDPVDFMGHMRRGNSSMGFNRYAYANNNPYKYTDPDGEFVNFIVGAVIGASIDAGLQVMAGMESDKSFFDSLKDVDLKSVAVSGAIGAVGMQGAVGLTAAFKGSAEFGVGAMKTTLQLGSKTERAVVGADSAAKVSAVAVVNGERNGSTATTVPAKLIDAAAGKPYGTAAEKVITKAIEEPKEEQK